MAQKEFVFKINGQQAATTIKGIQEQIKALDDQIATSNINDPNFGNLVKESDRAKNSLKTLQTEGIDGLKPKGMVGQLGDFASKLGSIPGPIGGVVSGINSMTMASLRFIATPVGAIIAALVLVFKAFQKGIESSEKAQQGLNKLMGAFSGIIGPVIKAVGEFAAVLIDGVVFAIDAVMSGLEKLGVDFATTAKDGMALAGTLNEIEEAEGDLEVARAQQNKTLAEAKEILSDTNKTYEERKKALDEIRVSEEKLAAQEVELAKKQVAAAQENIRLYGASKEANDKLDAARIKLANTEEAFASKKRQFNKEEKKLIAEQEATAKEIAAKAEERRKADLAKAKEYRDKRIAVANEIAKGELEIFANYAGDRYEERKELLQKQDQLEKDGLKKRLKDGDINQKEFDKLDYQREMKALDALHKLRREYKDRAIANRKEYDNEISDSLKERQDLEIKAEQERIEKIQAELEAELELQLDTIQDKYHTEEQLTARKDARIAQLNIELEENKKKITEKYAKEAADAALAEQEKRITAANLALEKGLNDGTIKIEEEEAKRRELEINALNEKIEILKKNGQDTVQAEAELYAKLNEFRAKDVADEEAAAKKKSDFRKQLVTESIQGASDLVSAVGSIQEGQMQAELMAAGDNLEKQEAIKKEYFEKNKKVQIAQAIIGAIQGAVGAFTSMSSIPIVGPILAGIAAAAALAAGYANVQKIRATSYESAAGGGGGAPAATPSKFAQGGLLTGRKHAEGGMATPFGELEGGEYVINREATASFLPLLDRINSMGSGSGAPNNLSANAETGNSSQPVIKAYVVASDMTSQQEANKRIADMARL